MEPIKIGWLGSALDGPGGGYDKIQDQVRLFLVSGMQHCNDGPDPVFFDTLTAMEQWVEKGVAPEASAFVFFAFAFLGLHINFFR